jgi:hypothetical protein
LKSFSNMPCSLRPPVAKGKFVFALRRTQTTFKTLTRTFAIIFHKGLNTLCLSASAPEFIPILFLTSGCLCASVPLCLCASAPLRLCASVPLCLCAFVPLRLCASVPLCLCAFAPLRLCAFVPLCLSASVPFCLCAFVPLCLCASVPLCLSFWGA